MAVSIAICDDTAEDIAILSEALYAYDHSFDIVSYTDGQTLIDDFLDCKHTIDILFLDIYMPGLSGMSVAAELRRRDIQSPIIFLTTSTDHALEAFGVGATQYLVKPYQKNAFFEGNKLQASFNPLFY